MIIDDLEEGELELVYAISKNRARGDQSAMPNALQVKRTSLNMLLLNTILQEDPNGT